VEVPPVELDPATYTCPEDHSDLSALVLQALGGAGLEVARAWRPPGFRSRPKPEPFEVIVTCPGPATRTLTVSGLPPGEPVTVMARGGSQQCRATLGAGSARPVITCGPASPG
jgi:hypothetical protein